MRRFIRKLRPTIRLEIRAGAVAALCCWYAVDPLHCFFPFLAGICLHELGHLAALRLLRAPVQQIQIGALGAAIQTGSMSYRAELLSAAAGPTVNLILFFLLRSRTPLPAVLQLFLAGFNLLPIWPLDGGRILQSALRLHFPLSVCTRIELAAGALTCACLACLAVYLTCVRHLGLWPVLLVDLLLIKVFYSRCEEKQVANPPPDR